MCLLKAGFEQEATAIASIATYCAAGLQPDMLYYALYSLNIGNGGFTLKVVLFTSEGDSNILGL